MIRRLKQDDPPLLEDLLKRIPNFSEKEVSIAMELILIAAGNPAQNDYHIFVHEEDGKILGYHCTGRRPLTDGVYDLYWIAVDSSAKQKGIGTNLLKHSENFVVENKGRWLLAETSSKDNYETTRNFYLRNNYSVVAEIKDFYSAGDGLIIFGKYFNTITEG